MVMNRLSLRNVALGAAVAGSLLAVATSASAQMDFSGLWHTNQGDMRIDQDGASVTGQYELKDGRVRGRVDGDTLSGIWAQSSAEHRCFEERMGTLYWGQFWLRQSPDGTALQGRWSYCNDDPSTGGDWTGGR